MVIFAQGLTEYGVLEWFVMGVRDLRATLLEWVRTRDDTTWMITGALVLAIIWLWMRRPNKF